VRRRDFLIGSTALCALGAFVSPQVAWAQGAALKIIVPATPGGGWDGTGRAMEKVLRQTKAATSVQVENMPGAGGTVALPRFLAMKGEPNTLLVTGLTIVTSAIANKTPNSITETTPIARLTGEAHVLVVPADSPFKTLADFVAAFKADPQSVSVTGGTPGGTDHLTLGMLADTLGIEPGKMNWVAYDGGGQAQTAILGNHVKAGISNWSEFSAQIEAGRMRPLAISADVRIPGVDVPTFKEQGHDVVLFNWRGVFAPPGLSAEDRGNLESLIAGMVKSEEWQTEAKNRKWLDLYLPADEFKPVLEEDVKRIKTVMQKLGFA
jgi:putative tricarboxylic transport membrane protein